MESKRVQLFFTEPSRTKQSFKDECDVNKIMKRFKKVQGVEFLNQYHGFVGGKFGDFSDVTDYRSALERLESAEQIFMAQPARVRAMFGNDTAAFLDFVNNPVNAPQLVEWGLLPKPVGQTPQASTEKSS